MTIGVIFCFLRELLGAVVRSEERDGQVPPFSVMPAFVFLRPGETKAVSVMFYPTSQLKVPPTLI